MTVQLRGIAPEELESTPGAAGRFDRTLATPVAPWHEGMF